VADEPLAYKVAALPRGMPDASFVPVQAALYRFRKAPPPPAWQLVASGLLCEEQVRVEYCADRQGVEPACSSAIPQSPPH